MSHSSSIRSRFPVTKAASIAAAGLACSCLAARAARPSAEVTVAGCHEASAVEALRFLDDGNGECHGNVTAGSATCLRKGTGQPYLVATLARVGEDRWRLTLSNVSDETACTIKDVRFPYDAGLYHLADGTTSPLPYSGELPRADGEAVTFTAQRLGIAFRNGGAGHTCPPNYACWSDAPNYPGDTYGNNLFSPLILLADNTRARILAATNWPPRRVATQWTTDRHSLVYVGENLAIRTCPGGARRGVPCQKEEDCPGSFCTDTSRSYEGLVAEVTGDAYDGNPPWMLAADRYIAWIGPKLAEEGIAPFHYPDWARLAQGMWNLGLQNTTDSHLAPVPGISEGIPGQWERARSYLGEFDRPNRPVIPWLYFDGEMSDYGSGPHAASCSEPRNATPFDCASYVKDYRPVYACCASMPVPEDDRYNKITCRNDALDIRLHPRYAGGPGACDDHGACFDLPAFVRGLVNPPGHPEQARHVAFYTRPYGLLYDEKGRPLPCDPAHHTGGIEMLLDWQANTRSWGADTYFVDTLSRAYYGDPLTIARLLRDGTFPERPVRAASCGNGIVEAGEECDGGAATACPDGCTASCTCRKVFAIEGANDLYTAAFLVDEALHQPAVPGGPRRTLEDLRCNPCLGAVMFPQLGTYVLSDRILIDGDSNTQFYLWGPCALCDAAPPAKGTVPCPYWVERQNFLLGHKFHSGRIVAQALGCNAEHSPDPERDPRCELCSGKNAPCPDDGDRRTYDTVDWRTRAELAPGLPSWGDSSPRYQDRRGIRAVPDGIDVRRFATSGGADLLVFDNPSRLTGRRVCFRSNWVGVPPDPISIVAPSGGEPCNFASPPRPPACGPAPACGE